MTSYRSALLFPGQGSQFEGMLEGLSRSPAAVEIFERARAVLGYDFRKLVESSDGRSLADTALTQPAVFVTSYALYRAALSAAGKGGDRAISGSNSSPEGTSESEEGTDSASSQLSSGFKDAVGESMSPGESGSPLAHATDAAGHSLGEYTALAVSSALTFEDALRLVATRGEAMKMACEESKGGMAALLGVRLADVEEACQKRREAGAAIWVANINGAGQVVISGEASEIERALSNPRDFGARRAVLLDISGPCHTPLMQSAADTLRKALKEVNIQAPRMRVWSNVTARPYSGPAEIADLLVRQLVEPVRWSGILTNLAAEGVREYWCFGPSGTMAGLARRGLTESPAQSSNGFRLFRIETFAHVFSSPDLETL
jgi:[acyl-carrier-protein] S-malonyltransferase